MIKRLLKHKLALSAVGLAVIVLAVFAVYQVRLLNKAHSTFDNYYAFRGCVRLVKRTPAYGLCQTGSGQTIKIVLYHGKWYLNGDLPTSWFGHLN